MVVVRIKEFVLSNEKIMYLSLFIGAKARRVRMDNQDGTADIPSITPAAEHLSTLTTLKEVREKWTRNNVITVTPIVPTFGGVFGFGTTAAARRSAPTTKKLKRTRTRTP